MIGDSSAPFRVKAADNPPLCFIFVPDIVQIIDAAAEAWQPFGYVPCCTAGFDGTHKTGSQHYRLRAVDFRTSDWPEGKRDEMLAALQAKLGPNFVFILETDHLHVERKGL